MGAGVKGGGAMQSTVERERASAKGPAAQERGPWARRPIGPVQRRASRDAGLRGLCFAVATTRRLPTTSLGCALRPMSQENAHHLAVFI